MCRSCAQVWGVDPGWNEVFVANQDTRFSTKQRSKAATISFSAGWYFQHSHVTTRNAKILQWQSNDPVYKATFDELPCSAKSSDPTKLLVG